MERRLRVFSVPSRSTISPAGAKINDSPVFRFKIFVCVEVKKSSLDKNKTGHTISKQLVSLVGMCPFKCSNHLGEENLWTMTKEHKSKNLAGITVGSCVDIITRVPRCRCNRTTDNKESVRRLEFAEAVKYWKNEILIRQLYSHPIDWFLLYGPHLKLKEKCYG